MAFSGLHILATYVGPMFSRNQAKEDVVGRLVASETMTEPGTSTLAAPDVLEGTGMAVFRVRAAKTSYVAIAAEPDAVTGPRDIVWAGEDRAFYAEPGHKLAWVVA